MKTLYEKGKSGQNTGVYLTTQVAICPESVTLLDMGEMELFLQESTDDRANFNPIDSAKLYTKVYKGRCVL